MSFLKKFADSSKELKNVRVLAACAMLLALRVVLGMFANFSLNFIPLPVVKISLTFIPIAIAGYLYGPVCAGVIAGLGDILSYLLQPTALGFNPGITVCYILEGVIYGVCLYRTELKIKDLVIAKVADLALCTLTLNSLVLKILFFQDVPFWQILLWRAAVLVPFAVIEIAVIRLAKPLLDRIKKIKV